MWGAWVAQLFKCPNLAQVVTLQFVGSSPASGSVLTARTLEPASDSVSPPLSVPPMLMLCLSLSLHNKLTLRKKKREDPNRKTSQMQEEKLQPIPEKYKQL